MMISTQTAAIYLRLSREDRMQCLESESIQSQRLLLLQYASSHQIRVRYQFVDDGISGTTLNRNAFQTMLAYISLGKIDTVLVKDLSRLSRDYIRTGELLEHWFPAHGVRLIAVNDGVDTESVSASNDFFPIRAIMDDWYARDISRKVRAAIYARQQAGYCTAAVLPYGYSRQDGKIILHIQQAEIVRLIFLLYLSGSSCVEIASFLRQTAQSDSMEMRRWSDTAVRRILLNSAYIGRLELHKTQKLSYKSEKKHAIPLEEHIVYPIPAMIPEAVYSAVQEKMQQRAHQTKPKHWLSGIVKCANCGALMYVSGEGQACRLTCSTRKRLNACRNPSVRAESLIQMLSSLFCSDQIPANTSVYSRLIAEICISPDTVTVRLRYKKPVSADKE